MKSPTDSIRKTSPNAMLIAAWRASRGLTPPVPLLIGYQSVVPLFEVERRRAVFPVEVVTGSQRDNVLLFPGATSKLVGD
jgi:hypothetical protein